MRPLSILHFLMIGLISLVLIGCKVKPVYDHDAYPFRVLDSKDMLVTLRLQLDEIELLKGSRLASYCEREEIPLNDTPLLRVWSAEIMERPSQQNIVYIEYSRRPDELFVEPENYNRIEFWELSSHLKDQKSIVLERRIRYTGRAIHFDVNPTTISDYDTADPFYKLYTREEPYLEQSAEIKDLARTLTGDEQNAYFKARAIYDWIVDNLEYYYPPEKRSALYALEKKGGDCGQYAYLFIALCRASGVPARFVGGFIVSPERSSYHSWAEVFLSDYGWIPVDPTAGQGYKKEGKDPYAFFGAITGDRLISSVGTGIPLKPVPSWATWENSEIENGRTDFMQLATVLSAGITFKRSSSIECNLVD